MTVAHIRTIIDDILKQGISWIQASPTPVRSPLFPFVPVADANWLLPTGRKDASESEKSESEPESEIGEEADEEEEVAAVFDDGHESSGEPFPA